MSFKQYCQKLDLVKGYEDQTGIIDTKIVDNNTVKITTKNEVIYRLYNTNVVIIKHDGTLILNSGGFRSQTTKSRISKYSGYNVYQKKGIWCVKIFENDFEFYDGMEIQNGKIVK
jgi:hypothetical protein